MSVYGFLEESALHVPSVVQASVVAAALLLVTGLLIRRQIAAAGGGVVPDEGVTLRNIAELRRVFGREVLVSVSRKSFLRALTGSEVTRIGPATRAAELFALSQGVEWIRTHEPRALRDAWQLTQALSGPL